MDVYPAVIAARTEHYLPFLAQHHHHDDRREARRSAARPRTRPSRSTPSPPPATSAPGNIDRNDLVERLAADARLGMTAAELQSCLTEGKANAGAVELQINHFINETRKLVAGIEGAETYKPGSIL
jgi:adenylosuccinate lyase